MQLATLLVGEKSETDNLDTIGVTGRAFTGQVERELLGSFLPHVIHCFVVDKCDLSTHSVCPK